VAPEEVHPSHDPGAKIEEAKRFKNNWERQQGGHPAREGRDRRRFPAGNRGRAREEITRRHHTRGGVFGGGTHGNVVTHLIIGQHAKPKARKTVVGTGVRGP